MAKTKTTRAVKATKKKSPARLESDIVEYLAGGGGDLFWPGGSGGGGSRRRRSGSSVVRPHKKTSPRCGLCARFHTAAEHRRHGDLASARRAETARTRSTVASPREGAAKKRAPRRSSAKIGRGSGTTAIGSRAAGAAARDPMPIVLDAISSIHDRGRMGDRKIFISELHGRARRRGLGMDLPEFKRWLVDQHRASRLVLARADLVAAMDPDLVRDSETRHDIATFHFVVDPAYETAVAMPMQAIRRAYLSCTGGRTHTRCMISSWREDPAARQYTRSEQDLGLIRAVSRGDVAVFPLDDRAELRGLSSEARAAALNLSGVPQHVLYLDS